MNWCPYRMSDDELHESLSSKDSIVKNLRASSKLQAKKLEVLEHNVGVLKNDCELLKASRDKAMVKVIRDGQLLMKKPDVVVPKDIVTDVLSVSGVAAKVPPSDSRSTYVANGNAARVCS
jgi:hypothetical protein